MRLLAAEGGWGKIWTGLAMAIALAGGGLIYQQVQNDDAECAFPTCFPDASNTGVPAGTSLTAYSGPTTITADDTVIDSKTVTSCLEIQAVGVIIRNSDISCNGDPIYIDDAGMYTETSNGTEFALTIEDSEISCNVTTGTGIWESYVHAVRVEITGCENGLSINQKITIEDSYIHNLASVGGDPHEDGIQLSGHWIGSEYANGSLNATIRHNTIYGRTYPDDGANGTSAIISNGDIDTDTLIEKNLLAGGAFTLYCSYDPGAQGVNYQVLDNHFSTVFNGTDIGAFGPSDGCANETLSGNVYHESGLPITLD